MLFALTSGTAKPGPGDTLRGVEDLDRALDAVGAGAATPWEVSAKAEPHERFPVAVDRWAPDAHRERDGFADMVRFCMLRAARDIYVTGDCWVLAYLGAKRHGLGVVQVMNRFGRVDEPSHLVLDLDDGRYLDAHGVSTKGAVLSRDMEGAWLDPRRLDADGIVALYDGLYGDDGFEFDEKLEDDFEAETEALFEMCLDSHVPGAAAPTMSP